MVFLREIVGDKIILGCGVPLGPAFGLVEYCRIGSDVALKWEDKFLGSFKYRERVSTINSLRSTIGRRHLNGNVFYNDPDVFILREKNNKLTKEQRKTLFILNLIFGGLVFTSDNIDEYSEEEMSTYLSLFPIKEKKIESVVFDGGVCRIRFHIDDMEYVVLSNLGSVERNATLDDGLYFGKEVGKVSGGNNIMIKPYETICLLKPKDKKFEITGSTGCVF
jgi:alpha-galactosidase